MPSLLRTTLVAKVIDIEQQIADWEQSDDSPKIEYQGRAEKAITSGMETSWRELRELIDTDDVEEEARPLVIEIDGFMDQLARFEDQEDKHPGGSQELWNCWLEVFKACNPSQTVQPIETPQQLLDQNVGRVQMARIYEWKTPEGFPDVERVNRELANPGSEFDPATHVPTRVKRLLQQQREAWERRCSRRRQANDVSPHKGSARTLPRTAPETLDQLLRQGVSSKQIALMKNLDRQTVLDYAAEHRIPVDGQTPPPIQETYQKLAADRKRELLRQSKGNTRAAAGDDQELINSYPELNNMDEQIRQMALSGVSNRQIVEAIKGQHPDVTPGRVKKLAAEARAKVGVN